MPSGYPTASPSSMPTCHPSGEPSKQPSGEPTSHPTTEPSSFPTGKPSSQPTSHPSGEPSRQPSSFPSNQPTTNPSSAPSSIPTSGPTSAPSEHPTAQPSTKPSSEPSSQPTSEPSGEPSVLPTGQPSSQPSCQPSSEPTGQPTNQPTSKPSEQPTPEPTSQPSGEPTSQPSGLPTSFPTSIPSTLPTGNPTIRPSVLPTVFPTFDPTSTPTSRPTNFPAFIKELKIQSFRDSLTVIATVSLTTLTGNLSCFAADSKLVNPQSNTFVLFGKSSQNQTLVLSINGLMPAKRYEVTCVLSTDPNNVIRQSVETLCCREVQFLKWTNDVFDSTTPLNHQFTFSYSIASVPESNLIVHHHILDSENTTSNAVEVIPQSVSFSSKSTLTGSFVLNPLIVASQKVFKIGLTFSGSDQFKYSSPSIIYFRLVSQSTPPQISSIRFGDNGNIVYVTFDSETDKAKISLGNAAFGTWTCNKVFSFIGDAYTSCSWLNSTCLSMTFCSNNLCKSVSDRSTLQLLNVGDDVVLRSGKICSSKYTDMNGACLLSQSQSVQSQPPVNPVQVLVKLSSSIGGGECNDDLIINPTATTGNGGRFWKSIQWKVSNSFGNLSNALAIESFMNLKNDISKPIVIPFHMLIPGIYQITLNVANYLLSSGAATAQTMVYSSSQSIGPTVFFDGGVSQRVYTYNTFSLSVSAKPLKCSIFSKLLFDWKVYAHGSFQPQIVSVSADPRTMKLLPYTLVPGTVYSFVANVSTTSGAYTILNTPVTVDYGSVFVDIKGASTVRVPIGHSLSFDASNSVYEDIPPNTDTNSPLLNWTCTVTSRKNLGSSCSFCFGAQNVVNIPSSMRVSIFTSNFLEDLEYSICAFSLFKTITNSDCVSITASSPQLPMVSIKNSLNTVLVNNAIKIKGVLNISSFVESDVSATWNVYDGNLTLDKTNFLTPAENTFHGQGLFDFSLGLKPNVLINGHVYSFILTAKTRSTNEYTFASVVVAARGPPSSGMFTVEPPIGFGFHTMFYFDSQLWTTTPDSLPLQYQFQYTFSESSSNFSSQPIISLGMPSQTSYMESQLPSGKSEYNNSVTCYCKISDVLSASTLESFHVIVVISPQLNEIYVSTLNDSLQSHLSTSDASAVVHTLNTAAVRLSAMSCLRSPNCSSLNRESCFSTAMTCGKCISGYEGIYDDSNYECISPSTEDRCGDIECKLYEQCVVGTCVPIERTCANDCSGNGQCFYYSKLQKTNSSEPLPHCYYNDSNCFPVCACYEGYYGEACNYNFDEFANRSLTRQLVCDSLIQLSQVQDASDEFLEIAATTLSLAFNSYELRTVRGISGCLEAFQVFVNMTNLGYINNNQLVIANSTSPHQLILNTVSEFFKSLIVLSLDSSSEDSGEKKHLQLSIEKAIRYAAQSVTRSISNGMIAGENSYSVVSESYQVTVMYDHLESLSGKTLIPPLTDSAASYGKSQSSLTFSSLNSKCPNTFSRIAIAEWGANPYATSGGANSSAASPLLRFDKIGSSFSISERFYYNVVLQLSEYQSWNQTLPHCGVLQNGDYLKCPCNVSSIASTNVTLTCVGYLPSCTQQEATDSNAPEVDLLHPHFSTLLERRRLDFNYDGNNDDEYADDSDVIDYYVIIETIAVEVSQTLTAKPSLRELIQAAPSLSSLIVLIILLAAGYWYLLKWDESDILREIAGRKQGNSSKHKMDERMQRTSTGDTGDVSISIMSSRSDDSQHDSPKHHMLSRFLSQKSFKRSLSFEKAKTTSINKFFENVLPTDLLGEKSAWLRFYHAVIREHDWICIFTFSSARLPRRIRYLAVITEVLILLFVDTLFYDILFVDDSCQYITDENECLSLPSKFQNDVERCIWDDVNDICSMRPPPSNIQFYMVVSTIVTVLSVVPTLTCSTILKEICALKPMFHSEDSDSVEGKHASELSKFVQLSSFPKDEKNKFDELMSIYAYYEHVTVVEEANMLLTSVEKLLSHSLEDSPYPWRLDGILEGRKINTDAVMEFIGVYPDGSPVKQTWLQKLLFGSSRNRVEHKIRKSRNDAKLILREIDEGGDAIDEQTKDTILIQHFILEQFTSLKRFALRAEFFQSEDVSAGFVDWKIWIASWTFIFCFWLLSIAWVFQWLVKNSGLAAESWAFQMFFVLLQEVFINEPLNIYIIHVVVIEALRPQLKQIYNTLKNIILAKMDGDYYVEGTIRVVQHLSGACRAARHYSNYHLPAAQLLMRIDDNDAALCRESRDTKLGWFISAFLLIPTALAMTHESIQEAFSEIVIPTIWCVFVLTNNYMLQVSVYFMMSPYIAITLYLLYRYLYLLPQRRLQASKNTVAIHEFKQNKKPWKRIVKAVNGSQERERDNWKNMNAQITLNDPAIQKAQRGSIDDDECSKVSNLTDFFEMSFDEELKEPMGMRHMSESVDDDNNSLKSRHIVMLPKEVSKMKRTSKVVEKFKYRDKIKTGKSAKFINKYVWKASTKNIQDLDDDACVTTINY